MTQTNGDKRPSDAAVFAVERQQRIVDLLTRDGRLGASQLASRFNVSTETIRRDFISLERAGALKRVHGGAVANHNQSSVPDVHQRETMMTSEKTAIARAAVELVPSSGVVLLDAGSTTRALAEIYPAGFSSTVVTPSLLIGLDLLGKASGIVVHLLGGQVSARTLSSGGLWATASLQNLHADTAFLGASGVSLEHGATTSDQSDTEVKSAMIAASRRRIILCDSSKVGAIHLSRFSDLSDIDVIVTSSLADKSEVRRLRSSGVQVIQA